VDKRWCEIMGERTYKPASYWKKHTQSGELWLSAEEMVEAGIVDSVRPHVEST
jgi:ATP-dependent protease ClpP protease subunit